jgi:hypothetical protein
MYARVTKFDHGDAEAMDSALAQISSDADSGPPEGVPATGFLLLADRDNAQTYAIGFFDTEEDLRTGDAALNAMTPPEGMGTRSDVSLCEVALKIEAPQA